MISYYQTCKRITIMLFLILLIITNSNLTSAGEISPLLQEKIKEAAVMEKIPVIIYLQNQVDLVQMEEVLKMSVAPGERIPVDLRYRTIITALMDVAEQSQPEILDRMQQFTLTEDLTDIQQFWIRNLIVAKATSKAIEEIAKWPDIGTIYYDGFLDYDRPVFSAPGESNPEGVEPGLKAINAHKLWELGYTGAGRIVMNIDTGVNGNNISFNTRWRGTVPGVRPTWAWHDPAYGTTFPNDGDASDNHGTHTMGTMCGLYASTNDTIGIAFNARWIASNSLIGGSPHTSRSIYAFQWAANPDSNINTMDDVPDVISNSWYDPNVNATQCDPTSGGYGPVIEAVEALGTAVVFSAGNGGPNASTVTAPKNRIRTATDIFCVGAVDGNNPSFPIASFSSRGPSTCSGPDSLKFKPEVSAPGVSVRSANGTSGYRTLSGTSMASPHVAGAIALLREAAPFMTGTELKYLLMRTATDLGDPGEDNNFGHGIIDLWRAYQNLGDPTDPNPPTNVSAYSDFSTPTSMFLSWTNPTNMVNGDPIGPFVMRIIRDTIQIAEIPSTDSTYTDTGLTDGILFTYTLKTRIIATDSLSRGIQVSWTAGGAKVPFKPTNLTVSGTSATGYKVRWTNPSTQIDGTRLDDFAGIKLYRDGSFVTSLTRTTADTARIDSTIDFPPAGLHSYYVTAIDNEIPLNESEPSNSGFTPLEIPFTDNFPTPGIPNTAIWVATNVTVDDRCVNPPSPPYAMNLNGSPTGNADVVEVLPLDLSGLQGQGVALTYFYQPRGNGDNPELADSLIIEFKNSLDQWILAKRYPGLNSGDPTPPFTFNAIGIDGVDPGTGTFFYNGFKFRFRSKGTTGAYDDWFVDDVFFGIPTGTANIGVSAIISPTGQISNNAPVNPVITVQNITAVQAGVFELKVNITGPGTPYSVTQQDSQIAAGSSKTITINTPFTPNAAGQWTITAITNLPGDPSAANDTLSSTFFVVNPIVLPLTDSFPDSGAPNPLIWTNQNAVVNADGDNEPSSPYSLNLAGNLAGVGLDTIMTLIIDLTGLEGQGVTLAYWQQSQGLGDVPEAADSLVTEALNNLGEWIPIKKLPGAANRPFAFEQFNMDSVDAGGGTFFHSGFKFRFRSRATTATTTRQDDWFVDDVFFGVPTGMPEMIVNPLLIGDTLLVGTVDSTRYNFNIRNNNPFAAPLNFDIVESPSADWLVAVPNSGLVNGGQSRDIQLNINFTGVNPGFYTTNLIVSGNDSTNLSDTVVVSFQVNAAPVISVNPDSLYLTIAPNQTKVDSFLISNSGSGPLTFDLSVDAAIAGAERVDITSPGGSSFTGSPRVRGNGFQITQDVTIIGIEFGLRITQDNTDVEFFIYESPTQSGTYTKIYSQLKKFNITPAFQLVVSDPMKEKLFAGKYYYIGAAWQGATSTEYRYSTVVTPPTWGTVLGRYIGPNTAFPGPATLSISSFTAGPYFSAFSSGIPFDLQILTATSGTVPPAGNTQVRFNANPGNIPIAQYLNYINIANNDPVRSFVRVPINVNVALSDSPFVTVTAPNGGERWYVGQTYNIIWVSNRVDTVKIEFSTNGGTAWNLISPSYPALKNASIHPKLKLLNITNKDMEFKGTYAWTIPALTDTPATNCLVKISSKVNPDTVFDISDGPFTITAAPPPLPVWRIQTSTITSTLYSVSLVDTSIAWAAGVGGVVVRTTNGGAAWQTVTSVGIDVHNIYAYSATTAFVASNASSNARILRTTDGGSTWQTVYQNTSSGAFINHVHMFDNTNGYAQGDPVGGNWVLLVTSDGGANWTQRDNLAQSGAEAGWNNSMFWIGDQYGWFGTNNTRIYRTTNGGQLWTPATIPFTNSYSVAFASSLLGIVGSNVGTTAKSSDGGEIWASAASIGSSPLYGMTAINDGGTNLIWYATHSSSIYKTTNFGTSWSIDHTRSGTLYHTSMKIVQYGNDRILCGYVVGSSGQISKYVEILRPVSVEEDEGIPDVYSLNQNYPNPFNPNTVIKYGLPEDAFVKLEVFNILGQRVEILQDGEQKAGYHQITFNSDGLASGLYFYRLEASGISNSEKPFIQIRKMLLVR